MSYVNSNYVSDLEDSKSIIKYYFLIGKTIIKVYSKQQYIVTTSIFEVKYIEIN